jgi:AcrR family transcriptional regulator
MKASISPRKAPRQARSQATVTAILDAAARVLVERGYAATNTNLVAELAGVSVGSLYQYFPNKDALITALQQRHVRQMNEAAERVLALDEDVDFATALNRAIGAIVEAHRVEASLHRVLERQLAGMETLDDHDEVERRMSEQILQLLKRYPDDVKVPDLRLATYVLMHSLHALVHAVVHQRPSGVSLKQATKELVRFTQLYLTAPA